MTQLKIDGKGTDLYAVKVPKDAYDYSLFYTKKDTDNFWWISYRFLKTGIEFEDLANKAICTHIISTEKIEILGEITKDVVGFDLTKYIICLGEFDNDLWYMDYTKGEDDDSMAVDTKEKSFYSLLAANGVHFVNPIKKPNNYNTLNPAPIPYFSETMEEWQSYESNLVEKVIILKQKI